MMKSQDEIIDAMKGEMPFNLNENIVPYFKEAMTLYAKEYTKDFIQRISHNPIDCYSQKFQKQEKQFFLGANYVKRLMDCLK